MSVKPPLLNVIVTCSARKSRTPLPGLCTGDLTESSFESRLAAWVERLRSSDQEKRIPARNLYMGDHWSAVKALMQEGQEKCVRVWIASAGCGLVTPETALPPYAATFSKRHGDSVATSVREARLWWDGVNKGVSFGEEPRSISGVIGNNTKAGLLVVGSESYLLAMLSGLEEAREMLDNRKSLVVLCRRGVDMGALNDTKVETAASLSSMLGGSLTSLNARLARWLIQSCGTRLEATIARRAVEDLIGMASGSPVERRLRQDDISVQQFIRRSFQVDARTSCTAALAAFRKSGLAVEQSRFNRLFKQVLKEAQHG